jgi:hypothetical protein
MRGRREGNPIRDQRSDRRRRDVRVKREEGEEIINRAIVDADRLNPAATQEGLDRLVKKRIDS